MRQLLEAIVVAGLPLAVLAFAIVLWALHRGHVEGATVGDLRRNLESLAAERKQRKSSKKKGEANVRTRHADPALDKWLSFGGNFYGLVALYTWLRIELGDVAAFFSGLGDIVLRFDIGAIIGLVIELFIESITNFVAAITWPLYWLDQAQPVWLWLGAAYGGYWLGVHAAQRVTGREWSGGLGALLRAVTAGGRPRKEAGAEADPGRRDEGD